MCTANFLKVLGHVGLLELLAANATQNQVDKVLPKVLDLGSQSPLCNVEVVHGCTNHPLVVLVANIS